MSIIIHWNHLILSSLLINIDIFNCMDTSLLQICSNGDPEGEKKLTSVLTNGKQSFTQNINLFYYVFLR
jgi:hypothetical protein